MDENQVSCFLTVGVYSCALCFSAVKANVEQPSACCATVRIQQHYFTCYHWMQVTSVVHRRTSVRQPTSYSVLKAITPSYITGGLSKFTLCIYSLHLYSPRKMVQIHWHDVCKVAQCVVQVVSLKLWYSAGWGAVSLLICHIHRQFGRKGSGIWLWVLPAQYLH